MYSSSNNKVTLIWSDGQITIVDRATIETYKALYGAYPKSMTTHPESEANNLERV